VVIPLSSVCKGFVLRRYFSKGRGCVIKVAQYPLRGDRVAWILAVKGRQQFSLSAS
jgi:hypothetical protein